MHSAGMDRNDTVNRNPRLTTVNYRSRLIRKMRQGPLAIADYAGVAKSKESLKVRVHILRSEGFVIETRGEGNDPRGRGHRKAEYVLISEPSHCCPTCGGDM